MTLEDLQKALGVRPQDMALVTRALTHRSYAHEAEEIDNERLEFLGDAVLQLCVTQALFRRLPENAEGDLTRMRASLVNTKTLGEIGRDLGLGKLLRLGRGEAQSGGRRKVKLLANTTEAVLGAIFLVSGFEVVNQVIERLMASRLDTIAIADSTKDPRTRLQELAQKRWQTTPTYRVEDRIGPAHEPLFRVTVSANDHLHGEGSGRSKQQARQAAAESALRALDAASVDSEDDEGSK